MSLRDLRLDRRAFVTAASGALLLPTAARGQQKSTLLELASRPMNYEAPLSAFAQRITPFDSFYIRGHFDTPAVDVNTWRVTVDGLVDASQSLSLADLEKMPQHSVEAVLQCSGNGRALIRPRVAGVQWKKGAMGNAVWRGPRVKDVLALARPRTEGVMLELEGTDRPVLATAPRFIRGIPLTKAMHDDTIIALQMNGRPLPAAHGFPARLIVPGWVGDDWTKWLGRLTVIAGEPKGFYYETAYRFPSGPTEPGVAPPADKMKPMELLNVKSVIGAPEHGSVHPPGKVKIVGVAMSGEQRIAKVEVALGSGAWRPATIVEDGGRYGFTLFEATFELPPGSHTLRTRATDAAGATQPESAVWNPSGYLFNAVDSISIEVRA